MAATIPLAKGFSEKHLKFPVYLSRKIDGVPVRIDIDQYGNHTTYTRQGKDMPSIRKLAQQFADAFLEQFNAGEFEAPCTLVGEVHQSGNLSANFKDTSGIVRRKTDQSDLLSIGLFDICTASLQKAGFSERYELLREVGELHPRVFTIPQYIVGNLDELYEVFESFCSNFTYAEGMVARNWDDRFVPGKRSWGYQKLLREPTIDLWIVGVEEAIDQHGNPKGMAGRLVASYKGTEIGIGPGRLTHDERIELWQQYKSYKFRKRVAQIKYKADDSYEALRQPTFQCWRDDKETPDA